ncbi:MAG: PQQ-like beta-propeller repeat protein [Planctomycetota bacterium]
MLSYRTIEEAPVSLRVLNRAARGTAAVAGIFSLIVCAMLVAGLVRTGSADPLNTPALEKLLAELEQRPDDAALKTQIRELDLLARRAYFTGREFLRTGALLLLAGVALTLASLKTAAVLGRRLPSPGKAGPDAERAPPGTAARRAVGVLGAALALTALALAVLFGAGSGPRPKEETAAEEPPAREEVLRNWPGFRGPEGNAHAADQDAPLTWDAPAGKGVIWKVPVPLPGYGSAVVWGDRVFLTGAGEKAREVFCFDAADGKLLWRGNAADVPGSPAEPPETTPDTGCAAPTPATDGRRLYAIFATGDVMAFDFEGRRVWARNLGPPVNNYGHASSLLVHEGTLLVQMDHDEGARLLGLEAATGKTLWEAERDVAASWASPIVAEHEGEKQVILGARPMIAGYDPKDGFELWISKCLEGEAEIGTSPAYAAGRVFVANDNAKCVAVDVKEAEVLWEWDEALPDVSSPVATDEFLFLATSGGTVTCLGAADGKVVWQHEFDEGFYSSPVLVGDRVYLMDREGVTHVFRAAGKFELLGSSPLGEESDCTPAFVGGRIYIRGSKHLFCIGKADGR